MQSKYAWNEMDYLEEDQVEENSCVLFLRNIIGIACLTLIASYDASADEYPESKK